jgi:hypothetical protein
LKEVDPSAIPGKGDDEGIERRVIAFLQKLGRGHFYSIS